MLTGYITYEELKTITGYSDVFLHNLIKCGLTVHEADLRYDKVTTFNPKITPSNYKQVLFNLQEVEDWLKVHIF